MTIYTPPCGGKVPHMIAMYLVEVNEDASKYLLTATLPLLGVATMYHCHWTPETFDEVAKLKVGETCKHFAASRRPVELRITRIC